jgi:hypothetical protein
MLQFEKNDIICIQCRTHFLDRLFKYRLKGVLANAEKSIVALCD